jgi:hypothetical protein
MYALTVRSLQLTTPQLKLVRLPPHAILILRLKQGFLASFDNRLSEEATIRLRAVTLQLGLPSNITSFHVASLVIH